MKKNIKIILILSIILTLSIAVRIYLGMQKEDLFMDETFSYSLMNSEHGMIQQIPNVENNWIKGSDITKAITIQENEMLNYKQVYNNQVADCHPFIYYFLLHTISIFCVDQFTMWTGLSLNILIWIGSFCVLYLIGKRILKNNFYSVLLCILYSFSIGAIGNTLLIRMYELFALNTLLLIYFVLKLLEEKEFKILKLLPLIIITILGFLTHYYFLLIAIPIYLIVFIKLLKDKRFKSAWSYVSCGGISGIICLILYPSCINHIFCNGRGVEAFENFMNIRTYLTDIKKSIHLINDNLFCGLLIPVGILIIIALICIYAKYKKEKLKICIDFKFILLTSTIIFYFLIVSKIAPYKAERYFVAIFPLIYIVLIMTIKLFCDTYKKKQKIAYVILSFMSILFAVTNVISSSGIWYLYKGTNLIYQQVYESKCDNLVYLYEGYCYVINNDIIRFMNFKNIYISNINNVELIKDLNSKEKVILYLPLEKKDYMDFVINHTKFNKYRYISTSWYGEFYLLEE